MCVGLGWPIVFLSAVKLKRTLNTRTNATKVEYREIITVTTTHEGMMDENTSSGMLYGMNDPGCKC
jgi:hypothetical protein